MILAELLMMAASANIFHFAIDYENEPNMKVAANNVNIKIITYFLNSGFRVTIAQWKTSGGLTRTGY